MDEKSNIERILYLIRKRVAGMEMSESEQRELELWVELSPERRNEIVAKGNDISKRVPQIREQLLLDAYIQKTQDKAIKRVFDEIGISRPVTFYVWIVRNWHLAAACILVVVSITAYLLYNTGSRESSSTLLSSADMSGDTLNRKAVLKLQNGRTVYLQSNGNDTIHEKGTLIAQKGDAIAYTAGAEGERVFNELRTPKASRYTIILPDSTKVFLNANSVLKFPNRFEKGMRNVKLEGEAFFEVKKDPQAPFFVVIGENKIEVLGTKFNVSGYHIEKVVTTLTEGSVKVSYRFNNEILKPGQQSSVVNGALDVREANISKDLAWMEGRFFFDNEEIVPIMEALARWYDVSVVYEGAPVLDKYTGSFKRSMTLEKVLSVLALNGGVSFDYNPLERKVTVTKSNK